MKALKAVLAILTQCVVFSPSTFAGDSANPARADACKADVQKLCGDVKPGHGAIWKCLNNNQSQASPACQASMTAAKQKMQAKFKGVVDACKDDATKFCKGHQARRRPNCRMPASASIGSFG